MPPSTNFHRLRAVCAPLLFCAMSACSNSPQAQAQDWPKHLVNDLPPQSQCNAQPAKFLEQQPYTQDTLARAMHFSGADEVRLLRVSQVITKEYKMGRVNVVVDDAMRTVLRVHCG